MIPAASTTALITEMGSSVWTVLYDNLPLVFGVVVGIAIIFFVWNKLMGFFRGGGRR
jgi:hypothetical protein